jgi:hypothetical protein
MIVPIFIIIMLPYFARLSILSCGALAMFSALGISPVQAQSALPTDYYQTPDSYIGIGGAIGLNGNTTSLGTGGVTVLSKLRFSDNLSLHDATVLFGEGAATSMIVLTADLPIRNNEGRTIAAPFIGGGVMLRYADGLSVSPAISGGVDIPLSNNFTGTVRVNAGFPSNRNADVGVLVGVGYSFGK